VRPLSDLPVVVAGVRHLLRVASVRSDDADRGRNAGEQRQPEDDSDDSEVELDRRLGQ
jgi:hypothetical protein